MCSSSRTLWKKFRVSSKKTYISRMERNKSLFDLLAYNQSVLLNNSATGEWNCKWNREVTFVTGNFWVNSSNLWIGWNPKTVCWWKTGKDPPRLNGTTGSWSEQLDPIGQIADSFFQTHSPRNKTAPPESRCFSNCVVITHKTFSGRGLYVGSVTCPK